MVVVAWITVGLGAATQAITGFGFSLVSAPFLIAAYHAPQGIQINLVLSVALNVLLVARNYRAARLRSAMTLLVPAAMTTVAAGFLLKHSTSSTWTLIAGALCLLATLVVWGGLSFPKLSGKHGTAIAGGLSGAMNVTTGVGGPPVVLFAINAHWPADEGRATLQTYFLGVNAVGLAILGPPDHFPLQLLIAVIVGFIVGVACVDRLPVTGVRHISLALAAIGSCLAIVRGA